MLLLLASDELSSTVRALLICLILRVAAATWHKDMATGHAVVSCTEAAEAEFPVVSLHQPSNGLVRSLLSLNFLEEVDREVETEY
uniref:Putative secreted protein n=1 Tax=Anopheles marajoara TaxID=58244 RepID=A0A2M4CAQ9_9DIPT